MQGPNLKRKVEEIQESVSKKARVEDHRFEDDERSELSTDLREDDLELYTHSTPLTPLSAVSTPRFPSDLKKHRCSFTDCNKSFNRPAKLAQHVRSHTNTRPFVCPNAPCTKDFLRESHLKHHLKSQHSNIRDYVCDQDGCGKSFITNTRLKRHQAMHDGKSNLQCFVEGCAQTFRKHGSLQKHIAILHEGKSLFVCPFWEDDGQTCGREFNTAGKLKAHEERAHGGPRFWCRVCSPDVREGENHPTLDEEKEGFSTYAQLQEHIVNAHPPTCIECGLRCKSQRELKGHIEVVHSCLGVDERRTHVCCISDCGRAFTKKGNLKMHIQSAHEKRRYVCGVVDVKLLNNISDWNGHNACGQALSTKANLEEHIRTAHLGFDHSRKHKNKAASNVITEARSSEKKVSTLVQLTGCGYENESGRNVVCLIPSCSFRFMRDYDLQIHFQSYHGLAYHEIRDLSTDTGTIASRPTWKDALVLADCEELQAEEDLDLQFDQTAKMVGIESYFDGAVGRSQISDERLSDFNIQLEEFTELKKDFDGVQDIEMVDPVLR